MIKLAQIFDFLMPRLFFGGGGGPSSSTVTQTNLPEYLEPYVMGMMGQATQQLFQTTYDPTTGTYTVGAPKPYTPYSQQAYQNYVDPETGRRVNLPSGWETVAGPTQAQQRASELANWMGSPEGRAIIDEKFGRAGQFAEDAGYLGKYAGDQALGYGAIGQQAGALGQQLGVGEGGRLGGIGAGYGQAAANLAPSATQYGEAGAAYGRGIQEGATRYGGELGNLGRGYGVSAAALTPEAQRYGQEAANIGRMGLRAEELGRDVGAQARGYAGQTADIGGLYERMATSGADVGRFMSPYQQQVTALQQEGAVRQAKIAEQGRKAAAARAGAFGGARQAIENAEAQRALDTQLANIEAQGLQQAYQQAQGNILNRAQLGLQGLTGAQQGLGTALQGGQLGLSGIGQAMAGQQAGLQGLGQAGQLYGLGMQGAQVGLQGLDRQIAGAEMGMRGAGMGLQGIGQAGQLYGLGMQGAGLGLQGLQQQLAGTAQGMQGAGMGLQGVQTGLGGYGLMGQMGGQLADITGKRFGQYRDIAGFQYGLGEQQRQLDQQALNQQIQNFAMMQETPYQRLAAYNALLRGYSQPGQTMTQYQAAPSGISQLAGLGLAGAGVSGLLGGGRKAGGVIKEGDGVDTLALNKALAGD